jgi:hypothetical protein
MISQLRHFVASQLDGCTLPVHSYKPDDVGEVPCVVVDRPTIDVNVQLKTVTMAVIVIGRRDGTEDAQMELDDTTSEVAHMLAGPDLAVDRIEPATAVVAELTYPAYVVSLSCGPAIC